MPMRSAKAKLYAARAVRREVRDRLAFEQQMLDQEKDLVTKQESRVAAARMAALSHRTYSLAAARDGDLAAQESVLRTAVRCVDDATQRVMTITAELAQADGAVTLAAQAVMAAQDAEVAAEVEATLPLWEKQVLRWQSSVPDPLHTPVNLLGTFTDLGTRLQRLQFALRDEMHIPIDQLMAPRPDTRAQRLAELCGEESTKHQCEAA